MCWLIRRKARVQMPGQTSKRKNMKIRVFLRRLPLVEATLDVLRPGFEDGIISQAGNKRPDTKTQI